MKNDILAFDMDYSLIIYRRALGQILFPWDTANYRELWYPPHWYAQKKSESLGSFPTMCTLPSILI